MPPIFRPSESELRRRAMNALEAGGKITNTGPGSVAGQLVDIGIAQVAELYDALDFSVRMANLSTATGVFLDVLGESRGVLRDTAARAVVRAEDRSLRFFSVDGLTPLATLLPGGQVPEGTEITDSGGSIVYVVARDYPVDQEQIELFVTARAGAVGAEHNVGRGVLNVSSLDLGTVGVTNDLPIATGRDTETDANYRFRISRSLDRAVGATEDAIRLGALGFPEVAEVRLRPFSEGLGSFEALVVPIGNRVSQDVLEAVASVLRTLAPYGTAVHVRGPDLLPVELAIELSFRPELALGRRPGIRRAVRDRVIGYVEELELGGLFVLHELVQRTLDVDPGILDMRVLVYRFRGEPMVLRNVRALDDEAFVLAEVSDPVRVL